MDIFQARRWLMPALSVLVLGCVLWLLHRALAGYHLRDVLAQFHHLSARVEWLAVLAALASYVLLCGYDLMALNYLGQKINRARIALTSFAAFAIGHNVGFVALSGAAIRLRLYGAVGVPAADVAVMSGFFVLTTALGSMLLIAVAMLLQPTEASLLLRLPTTLTVSLGIVLLGVLVLYTIWTRRRRAPLVVRNWSLALPSTGLTLAQTIIGAVDLCLAALCMYVLLPDTAHVSYSAFLAVYVLSVIAVMITNVPGGIGVLESVVILALPSVPTDQLLASLMAYRVIYYLMPLILAAVFLLAHETWLQRRRVLIVAGVARDWLSAAAPLAMGALILLAGTVLLISGATPAINSRIQGLSEILPLSVLEISHLLGSVAGLGLVVLSRALMRRVHLAWQVALGLLFTGALMSVLKGFDYEEAIVMLVVAGLLFASQGAFYRRAALLESYFNPRWLLGVAMIIAIVIWVGLLAHRHVAYSNELWWTFAFESDAPRMLRAALVVSLLTGAFITHAWLSPHAPADDGRNADTQTKAHSVVTNNSRATANLALLGDKRLLIHPAQDAFIMYQVSGRSWISMGDPVLKQGTHASRASELAWSFRELSDEYGGWTVFYQVTPEWLPMYVDLGLALLKLGEEARIALPDFSLEGSHRAEFRTARRRAEREGASFEVLMPAPNHPAHSSAVIAELDGISRQWLATKSAHEKRFSVGCFKPEYIEQFPIAVVRRNGHIVAFANLWPTADRYELSVDLMRYGSDAPPGVMDYLFVEAMLWGKAQGYEWFNLGMAPLSGLEQHYLAPAWHRIGNFVFDAGEQFYNFDGLRRYKQKFQPQWEPRYLAARGGLALPRVLLDVAALIAGGKREIFGK
jgi:phosphatidylglycerol lysyltransferase